MRIDLARTPMTSAGTTTDTREGPGDRTGRPIDAGTDSPPEHGTETAAIPIGLQVELLSRFEQHWIRGFAIAACGDGEFQLRRLSDGHVLPAWFPADSVRPILES